MAWDAMGLQGLSLFYKIIGAKFVVDTLLSSALNYGHNHFNVFNKI